MSFQEKLSEFIDALAGATKAPDEHQLPQFQSYDRTKEKLQRLSSEIRLALKRDIAQAEFIDAKRQEMFEAFDAGEKEKGWKAAWAINNVEVEKLR